MPATKFWALVGGIICLVFGLLPVEAAEPAGQWTEVKHLQVGDFLKTQDGWSEIANIEYIQEPITVYNLSVSEPHTFFANGILAHNKGCSIALNIYGMAMGDVLQISCDPRQGSAATKNAWIYKTSGADPATGNLSWINDFTDAYCTLIENNGYNCEGECTLLCSCDGTCDWYVSKNTPTPTPTVPGPTNTPVPDTAPSCIVGGDAQIVLGGTGDYSATATVLGGGEVAVQIGYNDTFSMNGMTVVNYLGCGGINETCTTNTTWTPDYAGTYYMFCQGWNALRECRPFDPYVYPADVDCAAVADTCPDGDCLVVTVVTPTSTPTPSPTKTPTPTPTSIYQQCNEQCDSEIPPILVCDPDPALNLQCTSILPLGNYLCRNISCPDETDCDCSISPTPSPSPTFAPVAWWQTTQGDVWADNGDIVSQIPVDTCIENACYPHLSLSVLGPDTSRFNGIITANNGTIDISPASDVGQENKQNWKLDSSTGGSVGAFGTIPNYAYWLEKLSLLQTGGSIDVYQYAPNTLDLGSHPKADKSSYYFVDEGTNNLILSGDLDNTKKVVILTSHNITIDNQITVPDDGGFLMAVAGGDIAVTYCPGADNHIDGLYIADGTFAVSNDSCDGQLEFQGLAAGLTTVDIDGRTFVNTTNNETRPVLSFSYRPDLIYFAPDEIKSYRTTMQEVNPAILF